MPSLAKMSDSMNLQNLKNYFLCISAMLLLGCTFSGCSETETNAEPDPVGGPPVMRRLTESQYRNTIADIFAPDIPISARFERPLRAEGLLAIGTGEAGLSPFSIEQYDAGARSVAEAVLSPERREEFVPCSPQQESEADDICARQFVEKYGALLLRRPLSNEDITRFVSNASEGAGKLQNFYAGLKFALVGMLVSPEFLLRLEKPDPESAKGERQQLDPYSKASRLSFFLTNSTPDQELLRAAGAGELESRSGLVKQVDRLIASSRFNDSVRAFFTDMLEFELFADLAKDPLIYPAYNSEVAEDAQEQILRTVDDLLVNQKADYRDLFTTRQTYLTRALGVVYRLPVATRNGWEKSEFPESSHRYGIHTNIGFLAVHSHPGRSSPTLRGKSVREVFLCQEVPDPPANVNFTIEEDPDNPNIRTARDLLELHNTEPACSGCHKIMDPPGLALENFDGVGTYRAMENGEPIDTSGSLDGLQYTDIESFGQALHDHRETPRCLVEKMYRYAVGRDTVWGERPYMDYLTTAFSSSGYQITELMRSIALSKNFFTVSNPDEAEENYDQAAVNETTAEVSGDRI